jgi:hypothetical protein
MRRLSALLAITIASAFAPSQSALSQQQQGTRSARMLRGTIRHGS